MDNNRHLFKKNDTELSGCFELEPIIRSDSRGCFVKTFHANAFKDLGLEYDFVEEYHSMSIKGVLRGLHFQLPPADHTKLVYCISGKVMDVAVDLRKNSKTYGRYHICYLDADKCNMLYIPRGMAHGFYTLSNRAVMMYHVTSVYDSIYDTGIAWDSVGIPWPDITPIQSERDRSFKRFSEFISPF